MAVEVIGGGVSFLTSSRYGWFGAATGVAELRLARPGLGLAQGGGGWLLGGRLMTTQLT